MALDLPTQCGYDSDDPEFGEEVGRVGVAVDTLADAEILFDGIPLDKISTSFTINGTAAILLAFYVAAAERKGVPRAKLTGTIQNDILKEYASRGTWIWPPEPSLRLIADTIEFCAAEVPRFNAISVAGRALPRRRRQRRAGDGVHAGRRRHLLRHRGAARPDDHRPVRARRSRSSSTPTATSSRRSPNTVRGAGAGRRSCGSATARRPTRRRCSGSAACAAARRCMRHRRRTTWCGWPTRRWRRCSAACSRCSPRPGTSRSRCPARSPTTLALRTQQILAYETGVAQVADPLGGSYFVEALTDATEARIIEIMDDLEKHGGMVSAHRGRLSAGPDRRRGLPDAPGHRGGYTPGGRGQQVRLRGARA